MSGLGDRLRASKGLEKEERAWRAWSVVERELKLRSYRDGDPLDDVFVVTPVERAHRAETRLGDVEARLQQVEAEAERADVVADAFRARMETAEAELSIAREALEKILGDGEEEDDDPGFDASPDFYEGVNAGERRGVDIATVALARLHGTGR